MRMGRGEKKQKIFICGLVVIVLLTGCAVMPIGKAAAPGDAVTMQFTCFQTDGAVAASSLDIANRVDAPARSPLFRSRSTFDPVHATVPVKQTVGDTVQNRGFEGEIIHRLAGAAIGMNEGERKRIVLADAAVTDERKTVRIARVRQRAKEIKMTTEEYRARTGRDAGAGQAFILDPAIPGSVASVVDGAVRIRFHAETGSTVETPFGRGTIREIKDAYLIDVDARAGTPVRSGPLAGRIVRADDDFIVIDYGQPLGGQVLHCDMEIISVEAAR